MPAGGNLNMAQDRSPRRKGQGDTNALDEKSLHTKYRRYAPALRKQCLYASAKRSKALKCFVPAG